MRGSIDDSHKTTGEHGDEAMPIMIRSHTLEEYVARVRTFHSYAAPGVIIGGFMVDLAYRHLPEGEFFDVLCETPKCLPDAIQLLTPCTVGNGWLTVVNVGRYALTVYDKKTGEGIRVFVDATKVGAWPEIRDWYFKLKTKKEQDEQLLMEQIRQAGSRICSMKRVKVADRLVNKQHRGGFAVCPQCNEAYPIADGVFCLACQGEALHTVSDITEH